jgi:multidrug resistance protein, MATE family
MQHQTTLNTVARFTKYTAGSIAEIATISLPLMLAVLSTSLMMFVDRLMLARFSMSAMNAAVVSGMTVALFQYGAVGIATIAEVFVGRRNGAGTRMCCGEPVWQMLYFALFSALIFWPAAIWGGALLPKGLPGAHEYFSILMAFGPTYPACAALSAFFVALGRVRTIALATILGNLVNVVLDLILIFGYPPAIPPLGVKGAALATGLAQGVQLAVLAFLFLRSQTRIQFGTDRWKWQPRLFWDCLRLGLPAALGHMIEIGAWAVLIHFLASRGAEYLAVMAIGQSLFVLFGFVIDGLQKGVTAVAANYLGANKSQIIPKVTWSASRLLFLMLLLLAIPLLLAPESVTSWFVTSDLQTDSLLVSRHARLAGQCVWAYFLVDGLLWVLAGVLTAGGDTRFVMVMNGLAAWLFSLVPTYIAVAIFGAGPAWVWPITLAYCFLNLLCFYWRYKAGLWKSLPRQAIDRSYPAK